MVAEQHPLKHGMDVLAGVGVVASIAGYIPAIAGLMGIIWYGMQMWDWIQKKRSVKKLRRRKTDTE